ncbi:MAG TPA: metal ABC transporter substrate-binding protein [Thermoanaerobaculia bacterium]|nr:metal ABC transporter substrate-binding protein [Thermoanaerobaculia bacterium]
MKRIVLALALTLFATNLFAAAKLNIVTTTQDLASLTHEVGGDLVTVTSIARGYQDPHFVEPKPSFLLLLKSADLLEVIGLDLEIGWLPPLIDQSRNAKIQPGGAGYLDVSRGVEIFDRPNGAVNRSMGDVHPLGNPHYWLDPANAVRMAIQIEKKLEEMQPANAAAFQKNLNTFKQRINEADKRWRAALAPYRGAKIVAYHNSWPNFARRYGLNIIDYVEPKPGVPPSPSHTFALIGKMKDEKVKAIIMEPYFDKKTPQSIAERTGANLVVIYPSVGGAKTGTDDYFQLFDTNVANLVKALK